MKLNELVRALGAEELTPQLPADQAPDVTRGYVSDLLSDVLANAPQGGVLVTGQVHLNVIAVAVNAGLVAVIFPMNREPDAAVHAKAVEEGIRLFRVPVAAFDVVGRLFAMGLRGPDE